MSGGTSAAASVGGNSPRVASQAAAPSGSPANTPEYTSGSRNLAGNGPIDCCTRRCDGTR